MKLKKCWRLLDTQKFRNKMKQNKKLLFSNAKSVFSNAYAPYSRFNVSVSLLGINAVIYTGVNVENSAFPQGMCAEAAAIGKMVTDGCTEINEILVMADTKKPTTPCGGCRQRLMEFSKANTPVYLCNLKGFLEETTIGLLLPGAFDLNSV